MKLHGESPCTPTQTHTHTRIYPSPYTHRQQRIHAFEENGTGVVDGQRRVRRQVFAEKQLHHVPGVGVGQRRQQLLRALLPLFDLGVLAAVQSRIRRVLRQVPQTAHQLLQQRQVGLPQPRLHGVPGLGVQSGRHLGHEPQGLGHGVLDKARKRRLQTRQNPARKDTCVLCGLRACRDFCAPSPGVVPVLVLYGPFLQPKQCFSVVCLGM